MALDMTGNARRGNNGSLACQTNNRFQDGADDQVEFREIDIRGRRDDERASFAVVILIAYVGQVGVRSYMTGFTMPL